MQVPHQKESIENSPIESPTGENVLAVRARIARATAAEDPTKLDETVLEGAEAAVAERVCGRACFRPARCGDGVVVHLALRRLRRRRALVVVRRRLGRDRTDGVARFVEAEVARLR